MHLAFSSSILAWLAAVARSAEGETSASYEVWGVDQSNSVPNASALGVDGSWLWIWDSDDVADAVVDGASTTPPKSKPCTPDATEGPCDLLQML